MVTVGYLMISAGFLAGAYFAVLAKESVAWPSWAAALVVGVVGVVLARWGRRSSANAETRLAADFAVLATSLDRLVAAADRLVGQTSARALDPYEVRHLIDAELVPDLTAFAAARESIRHRHGVQAYAEVMTSFALGERYLNRAWSASTDGWIDEVATAVERAAAGLREARGKLAALSASS